MTQPSPTQPAAKQPPVILLVGLAASGSLSLTIFVPSIPGLVGYFATELGTVQLVMSMYLVAVATGQLAYGPLSDRFGRRPVLLIGLSIYLLGSIGCVVAPTIEVLVGARIVQAIGASCGLVLCRAMVGDIYARERAASVLGYVMTAMAVVPALAPTLGGILDRHMSWRAGLALVAAFGAAVLVLAVARGYETLRTRRTDIKLTALVQGYVVLLQAPRFLGYAFNSGMVTASFVVFLTGAAVLMIDVLGYSPDVAGPWFMTSSVSYMIGNFLSGRFSQRIGLDRMVFWGTVMALVSAVAMGVLSLTGHLSAIVLFASMSIISIGNGCSQPNAMAGAIGVDPRYAGTAAGITGFLQMALGAVTTVAVGHFLPFTNAALAIIMSTALFVAPLAISLTRWPAKPAA